MRVGKGASGDAGVALAGVGVLPRPNRRRLVRRLKADAGADGAGVSPVCSTFGFGGASDSRVTATGYNDIEIRLGIHTKA